MQQTGLTELKVIVISTS